MTHNLPPRFVTSAEAAQLAGLSTSGFMTLHNTRDMRLAPPPMPVMTVGRAHVWDREAIEAWAATRRRPGRPTRQQSEGGAA